MDYITTTGLRTQSSQLIRSLKQGNKISLIHRSKIVGVIQPVKEDAKPFNVEQFNALIQELHLPKTTDAQREKIYRKHLEEKYGKSIS